MKEAIGELFDQKDFDCIAITTNATLKKNGEVVMGRGCALQAKTRWSGFALMLGKLIHAYGNHVFPVSRRDSKMVVSFPVKHNYWEEADIELIKRSCTELMELLEGKATCVMPRPGCGNGKLKWEDVKPVIEPLLGDNVTVITK